MKFKFDRDTRRSFWFNLVVVLLLGSVLYAMFFVSLGWITHHSEHVVMPNVLGQDMNTAIKQMEDMTFEVIVDSAYEPKIKPLTVLKQIPDSGSVVKKNRTVFITVNKIQPPLTPMPNLISLSYRSAEMILKNNKLIPGDTTYKPDIAQGAVLQQSYKGIEVKPGQMIPQGSRINMVLGDGLGNTEFNVPDLIGMSYEEGIANIMGTGLQYNIITEGDITDTPTAIIYNQAPSAMNELGSANRIKEGDIVDIFVKQNPTDGEMDNNRKNHKGVNNKDNKPPNP